MKIVINSSYGVFQLSEEAHILYSKLKGYNVIVRGVGNYKVYYKNVETDENIIEDWNFERNDPDLVNVVETLGEKSGDGKHIKLKVVEIPDDVQWYIHQPNDGQGEWIAEKHRTWN